MKTFKLTLFLFFCFVFTGLFSQTKTATILHNHYRYTFSGELTSQLKADLEKAVSQLNYVTECKVKYKPEANGGELFLFTEERTAVSESDNVGFNILELKKLILSFNITPLEFNLVKN